MKLTGLLIITILTSLPGFESTRREESAGRRLQQGRDNDPPGRFIVGFKWDASRDDRFIWPSQSMKPSSYTMVVMQVEGMPGVTLQNGHTAELSASRHLRINGRIRKPDFAIRGTPCFRVELDEGRLHLSIQLPAGATLEPGQRTVRVELFENSENKRSSTDLRSFSPPVSWLFGESARSDRSV